MIETKLTVSVDVLRERVHLQQKSVLLEEHLIKIYNNVGDVILDVVETELVHYTFSLFLRYSLINVDRLVHDSARIRRSHFLDVHPTLTRSYYDGTLKPRAVAILFPASRKAVHLKSYIARY